MKKLVLIGLLSLMGVTKHIVGEKPQCGTKKHLVKLTAQFKNQDAQARNKMIAHFLRVSSVANSVLADRLLQGEKHNDRILIKKISWALEKNLNCILGKAFAEKLLKNLFSQETTRPFQGMEENLSKMYENMLILLTQLAINEKNTTRQAPKTTPKDPQ